jgi:hypothetical protein
MLQPTLRRQPTSSRSGPNHTIWQRVFMRTARILLTAIQKKAASLIEHAIALDVEHPTYLTVLALAYFRSGKLEQVVVTQRQVFESPRFPAAYREEAIRQLQEYEAALATRKPEKRTRGHGDFYSSTGTGFRPTRTREDA